MPTANKSAGELRHKVRIIELGLSQTAGGATEIANYLVGDAWGAVEALQGRELYAAQQRVAEVTHKVTIRYRSGIKAKNRVWYGNREFQVAAVYDQLETREFLVLLCIERNDSSRDGQGGVSTPGTTPLNNSVKFTATGSSNSFDLGRPAPNGVLAFWNGQQLNTGDDYEIVGNTFTMTATPGPGDHVTIFFF